MSEETKDTTVTEPAAPEPQTEPTQPAEALTAEAVSKMIADAVSGLEQRQSEAKKLAGDDRPAACRNRARQLQAKTGSSAKTGRCRTNAADSKRHSGRKGHSSAGFPAGKHCHDRRKTTKEQVEAFSKLFSQAVDDAVKERLKGDTPKRGTSTGMTKEQIFAIKDDAARIQAINQNMHLFV